MNPHQALIAHSAALPFPRESIGGRPGVCQGDSPDSPPNFALVPALFPDFFVIQKNQQQTVLSALGAGPRPSLWFGTEKTSGQSWEDYRTCSAVIEQGLHRQEQLGPRLDRPRA